MKSNEWKLPLNLAIGVHILALLGTLYFPGIFAAKPKFADIYTVSIINIAEPTVVPPPPTKTQPVSPPPIIAPPSKTKKLAPIAEVQEKIAPTPQKSISLKPLKKKKIQKIKPPENQVRRQEIARQNRQRLAEAIREEELLAEKAKRAQAALEAERTLLKPQQQLPSNVQTIPSAVSDAQNSTATPASSSSSNLLESQYLASIFNRLHQFWTPPEYLQQEPNLTTIVVITISLDGKIGEVFFESKSGNRVFDQFVSKTIASAAPMPPIPPALKRQQFEIGLRFRPGSIQ
jgi:colicin import membrane protein